MHLAGILEKSSFAIALLSVPFIRAPKKMVVLIVLVVTMAGMHTVNISISKFDKKKEMVAKMFVHRRHARFLALFFAVSVRCALGVSPSCLKGTRVPIGTQNIDGNTFSFFVEPILHSMMYAMLCASPHDFYEPALMQT